MSVSLSSPASTAAIQTISSGELYGIVLIPHEIQDLPFKIVDGHILLYQSTEKMDMNTLRDLVSQMIHVLRIPFDLELMISRSAENPNWWTWEINFTDSAYLRVIEEAITVFKKDPPKKITGDSLSTNYRYHFQIERDDHQKHSISIEPFNLKIESIIFAKLDSIGAPGATLYQHKV